MSRFQHYWNELQRRHVFKAGIAYLVAAWLIIQVVSILLPMFRISDYFSRVVVIILAVGFPIWLIIAWIYDFSLEGIKRTEDVPYNPEVSAKMNVNLNRLIIGGLSIAVVLLVVNTLRLSSQIAFDEDGRMTLAVLPFDNLSPNPQNEWIGDAVTEDILTYLARNETFRVISRTSVMKYKGLDKTIPEISRELGANYLVEGSVRIDGDDLLITAQLIDSEDRHIWADRFREKSDHILEVQASVAQKVTKVLLGKLAPSEVEIKNDSVLFADPEARKNVRIGDQFMDRLGRKYWNEAEKYYKKALEIQPDFYQANASYAYLKVWGNPVMGDSLAEAALKKDPKNDKAWASKAVAAAHQGRFAQSMEILEKALKLNKDAPWTHDYLASLYLFGLNRDIDYDKAYYHSSEAVRLDPLSQIIARKHIFSLIYLERIREADSIRESKKLFFDISAWAQMERLTIQKLAEIKSIEARDYSAAIEIFSKAIDSLPIQKAILLLDLAVVYDHYFNDDPNYLKYMLESYKYRVDINEIHDANLELILHYFGALLENRKFKEAQDFLFSPEIQSEFEIYGQSFYKQLEFAYYLAIGDHYNAQDIVTNWLAGDILRQELIHAHAGKWDRVKKALATTEFSDPSNRAQLFALMKEADSVFFYLNDPKINPAFVNSNPDFDPYRRDPRFIAFREKYFLQDVTIQ